LVGGELAADHLLDEKRVKSLIELGQSFIEPEVSLRDKHSEIIGPDLGDQIGLGAPQRQVRVQQAHDGRCLSRLQLAAGLDDLLDKNSLVAGGSSGSDIVRLITEAWIGVSPSLLGRALSLLNRGSSLAQRRIIAHSQLLQFRKRQRMAVRARLWPGQRRQRRQARI